MMQGVDKEHIFLCDLTHMGQKIASDCFPLGIGCLATYLEATMNGSVTAHLFKFPDEVYDAVIRHRPRIVGFSNYVWNLHLGISMATAIKKAFPETVVVFGGPNFPRDREAQEEFLRENDVIDFYIEGEGEKAFHQLVQNLLAYDYDIAKVKGLLNQSVRTIHNGKFVTHEFAERTRNLEEIPSPYLTGKMDRFFDESLMPLIQTTRGCPFTCTYCVEGDRYYQQVVRIHSMDRVAEEMEYIAKRATGNKQLFIADSNFGMYNEDLQVAKIIREAMDRWDYPAYIHVATGKNRKDLVLELAGILKGRLRLSGSVQSLDPKVLAHIKRKNIVADHLLALAHDARKVGANSYSEVILGLPGDSLKAHMGTMKRVIEAGFNYALPWTLMLLLGSELAGKKSKRKFGMVLKYRILPRCFGVYRFGDEEIISAEIEEVCVGGDRLSFEDYLECRLFTLTTALFYNDRIFEEILESFRPLRLSPFEWLLMIHNARNHFPETLKEIYGKFKKATIDELWDTQEELRRFVGDPEVIKKYISGDLGINVMYHHRTLALINCMQELNDIAFQYAKDLIKTKHADYYQKHEEYFEQLKLFSFARKADIFDFELPYEYEFAYDFKTMLDDGVWHKHEQQDHSIYKYRFSHSPEQKRIVREQMNVFGSDITGLAKVMSRVNIRKMYRQVSVL